MSHILFIDNFDSFTFNLVDAFSTLDAQIDVYRNTIQLDEVQQMIDEQQTQLIVLSPGPGTPADAGCCISLIQRFAGQVPIFGVCLGHQAMVEAFGGVVAGAGEIIHGKKSAITHQHHPLFQGLPSPFDVARYHSLVAHQMPEELEVIADYDGMVMALAHRQLPVYGVQFHPESMLTTYGQVLLRNLKHLAEQDSQKLKQAKQLL